MVSGLAGGRIGETEPGIEAGYYETYLFGLRTWDAYTLGLLIAVIVIVIGGIWSLITASRNLRKRSGVEE